MTKKMNELYERTNIFIIDPDTWIESKRNAEILGYNSVSSFIFELLHKNNEKQFFFYNLLFELEKYFELEYYTLSNVAEKTGIDTDVIIKIMINDFGFKFIDKDEKENVEIIHSKLIENSLLPRELSSMISLKKRFQRREELETRELLEVFFPNPIDRKAEILTYVNNYAVDILSDEKFKNPCKSCKEAINCDNDDIRDFFYELGIEFSDDFFEDPLIEEICNKDLLKYYGRLLMYSADEILEKELIRLENLKLEDVELVEGKFSKKLINQKKIIHVKVTSQEREYGFGEIKNFNRGIITV